MLDNLTRPGYADFFHHQQNDPGYQQWRAEADRLAANNADLRTKLSALDARLASEKDQPRDPNYLPPDTPREVAVADGAEADADAGGGFSIVAIILVGGGVILLIWLCASRRAAGLPVPAGKAVPWVLLRQQATSSVRRSRARPIRLPCSASA